jgi:hypothetical protein
MTPIIAPINDSRTAREYVSLTRRNPRSRSDDCAGGDLERRVRSAEVAKRLINQVQRVRGEAEPVEGGSALPDMRDSAIHMVKWNMLENMWPDMEFATAEQGVSLPAAFSQKTANGRQQSQSSTCVKNTNFGCQRVMCRDRKKSQIQLVVMPTPMMGNPDQNRRNGCPSV